MQPKGSLSTRTPSLELEQLITIPRKRDFRFSILGKRIRTIAEDPLHSEGLQILATVLGLVCLAFIQFIAWAILSDEIIADPFGPTAITFWSVQIGVALAYLAVTLVGTAPSVKIRLTSSKMIIESEATMFRFHLRDVTSISTIDADIYQKHYRRYKESTLIGHTRSNELLLIWHDSKPYVLALDTAELRELNKLLEAASERRIGREQSIQPAL